MIIGLLVIFLCLSTQVLISHKVGHYHLVQFLNQILSVNRRTWQSNHTYVRTATIQQPRCVGVSVGKKNSSDLSLEKESLQKGPAEQWHSYLALLLVQYHCKSRTNICKEVTWYRKSVTISDLCMRQSFVKTKEVLKCSLCRAGLGVSNNARI
jgi:hypothetical protein